MAPRDALFYDPITFRKHFENIGRAYQEQATTLIEICRLYAEVPPHTYTEDDRLQKIIRLADVALIAAGKARKGRTLAATNAFLEVQDEIIRFGSPPPRRDTPGDRRNKLPDPRTALANAAKKDKKASKKVNLSTINSAFLTPSPKEPIKKVNFVILESPHERRQDLRIVHQKIDEHATAPEIIWNFCRYPEKSPERMALKQNPHFYLELSDDPASYGNKFHKYPLRDFAYLRNDTFYVIADKSCRLFLDAAEPRIFGNLWKPHQTIILKDVGGILESEDVVFSKIQVGKRQDFWHRPSFTDSSQRRTQPDYLDRDSEFFRKPVGTWRALLDLALRCQNVDLMVRDQSRSYPPADSGWVGRQPHQIAPLSSRRDIDQTQFPSPKPSSTRVPGLGEQTTLRQSTTHLPQQLPNTSVPSIGGNTLSPSTEPFGTLTNPFDTSLHTQAGAILPQSVDRGVYHATPGQCSGRHHAYQRRRFPSQSAVPLPPSEHSIPTFSFRTGGSTLPPSTESFETAVNTSEVSLPSRAAADIRSQFIDHGIYHATSRQPTTSPPRPEYSNNVPSIGGRAPSPSIDSFEMAVNTSDVSLPMNPQSADSKVDQVTSRLTVTCLLGSEYSNPNIPSIGGSTSFSSSSTASFVDTSEVSLPIQSAVGQPPQFVDSGIDQTKSRQPVTRLPHLESTNAHARIPSLGRSALFATSTESFEAIVNASVVSLPTRAAVDNPPQSVDNQVDLLGEMPSPADLPPELCYSSPNFSNPGIISSSFMFIPNGSLETLCQ